MMNAKGEFFHSLAVDADLCVGCAHCIRRCPTKALRIREGKASLRKNWCIDCGECLKVCPVGAIYVGQDDFDRLSGFACRVALIPAALLGQFPETDSEARIVAAIRSLGFQHIYPVELTAGIIREQMAARIAVADKPAISPFCPAVVRLIQTKFPELTGNILSLRTPVEATAVVVRRRLEAQGHAPEQIGIFYVTPCAAKAAAIKDDAGPRLLDGTLNLDTFYNKVSHVLRNRKNLEEVAENPLATLPVNDLHWSMTAGEASAFTGRSFAVDGIHDVAEFLERLQTTGELHRIDFLELRACNRGCPGGALTPANRFLAEERLRNRASGHPQQASEQLLTAEESEYLEKRLATGTVPTMTKLLYQGDIEEVLQQMNAAKQTEKLLPGIDCGACGSPTCRSLSNDIVRGEAVPENCIFLQLVSERTAEEGAGNALRRLEKVWGRERFEKNRKPQK